LCLMELMGRVKQCLGWDAAHIQAGATERASLLDADSLEPALAGLDSCDVAAWAASDDGEVVFLGGTCREEAAGDQVELGLLGGKLGLHLYILIIFIDFSSTIII
jgi:hypothetical protein